MPSSPRQIAFFCGCATSKKKKHSQYNDTVFFFLDTAICCCETGDLIGAPHWPDFSAHIMGFLQDMQSKCPFFLLFSLKINRTFISLSFMVCYADTLACAYGLPNLHHARLTWAITSIFLSLDVAFHFFSFCNWIDTRICCNSFHTEHVWWQDRGKNRWKSFQWTRSVMEIWKA